MQLREVWKGWINFSLGFWLPVFSLAVKSKGNRSPGELPVLLKVQKHAILLQQKNGKCRRKPTRLDSDLFNELKCKKRNPIGSENLVINNFYTWKFISKADLELTPAPTHELWWIWKRLEQPYWPDSWSGAHLGRAFLAFPCRTQYCSTVNSHQCLQAYVLISLPVFFLTFPFTLHILPSPFFFIPLHCTAVHSSLLFTVSSLLPFILYSSFLP